MNFSPSRFRSFMAVIVPPPLPARRHTGRRTNNRANTTRRRRRHGRLKANVGTLGKGGGGGGGATHLTHTHTHEVESATCLNPLCNYTRREPQMAQPRILSGGELDWRREHLRCEADARRGSIKNTVSQDHSGHKEGGQPSRDDWMSPHTLGLSPASKDPAIRNAIQPP